MTDSPPTAPAANSDDIPDFATLAADPEIAPLLGFEPVFRQVKRPNGWTDDLQRELIARIAATGTLQQAVWQMGKHATGAEALYRVPSAISFRAAWDEAVAIGRRRQGLDCGPPHLGPVPGITRRGRSGGPASMVTPPEPDEDSDDTALKLELIERLIAKYQRKVGQEREARLAGEVVEADFTLRQITCLEVAFDLMIEGHGDKPWTMLMEVRRGTRNMLEIADTYMARVLDQARRDQWAAMAEPERPEPWPERYLLGDASKVDARLEPLENAGKASRPAASYALNDWCQLDPDEQRRIYDEQHRRDAEAQIAWEAESAAQASAWRARQSTAGKANDGEADAST
jgi:hypothetical protein